MYHYKARIYSPSLGRFLQTDPIGYEDQVNLYAYVGNDPINGIDPTGMICTGSRITGEGGEGCKFGGNVNPGIVGTGTSSGALPGTGSANATSEGGNNLQGSPGQGHNGGPPLDEPVAEDGLLNKLGRLAGRLGGALVALAWAEPAGTNSTVVRDVSITEADLNPAQLRNFQRMQKKLPSASSTSIARNVNNESVSVVMHVPGRVPGSFANYVKVMDRSGVTTRFVKLTRDNTGQWVHVKVKH